MDGPAKVTFLCLMERTSRTQEVVTMLIANAARIHATMQNGNPHHDGLVMLLHH